MDRQKAWGQRQNWHSQHARRSGAVRLGKAGTGLRGATLDARLYQEALRRNGREEHEETIRDLSRLLLTECERVKEALSFRERASLSIMHPRTGEVLDAEFTRAEFETLLEQHGATREPIRRVVVKATYTGQTQMGIDIFEMGDSRAGTAWELVFDPSGAARVVTLSEDQQRERTRFWMNEHAPTFLTVNPPAQRGEPCFEVLFAIDANKRLLITVRDLRTMRLVMEDYPVVRLT